MKQRQKPYELQIYEALLYRKVFSSEEMRKYRILQKGYEGELQFDRCVENLPGEYLRLRDLWLPHRYKFFQIDYGLIINNTFFLYELKNYKGEFFYENDKLYLTSGKEIDDPLTQLARADSLLHQLLQELDIHIPIQSAVIFVNPEFTLLQAPRKSNIILPSQLNRYLQQLYTDSRVDPICYKIAKKLKQVALPQSPFQQLPDFSFTELKKGLRCQSCRQLETKIDGKMCVCDHCGEKEQSQSAILRNMEELQFLFPQLKLTTAVAQTWMGIESKKRILYVLNKYFYKKGKKKGSYYIINPDKQ
ncbi:Nuclease-related domain-containing protein [Gracilibacillus orientalis]|uniref:Nuclease-related domain-containing protein n=1 Tax=Gracilibacillus orientalis TaxID=334253 RepID=A0A1I4R3W6_9BACI|nr:nuclease-related domain-containing protein [Gracilibacillus orientalis]SFM46959.1 Nuclease-related domain-containing protein [Gracilibacillus orientalis]